jgi:3-oxoacyl-[acyl-carrier-protein] synthase II
MSIDRIVITGIGVVSSIGKSREAFWESCLAGRSGTVRLHNPWVVDTDIATKIAAPIRDFDPVAAGVPSREVSILDRATCFALAAGHEALVDARLTLRPRTGPPGRFTVQDLDPSRLAVVVGTGIGGLSTFESAHTTWLEARSKRPAKRYSLVMLIPNAASGQLAIRFGAQGECKTIVTACASGTMAIGDAWRLLGSGDADVVLAGGVEGTAGDPDAFALLGFDRLKTLSTRNDEPERASRPFDRDRDGFVLGEGAAFLVLEREGPARARGAVPYAAITGYASSADAVSMMQLDESGSSIVALGARALERAGRDPSEVEHVSAHGTSTVQNDRVEAKAFRRLFGSRIDRVPVTAVKSMTGHAIGASGALETAALAMGLRRGMLTPTINYETPDPECELDIVANVPRSARPGLALKFSYGFGGHNACLVLEPASA